MSALARIGEIVCRLGGSRVATKRYLTAIDPAYYVVVYTALSAASKKRLGFEGGPVEEEEEAETFM